MSGPADDLNSIFFEEAAEVLRDLEEALLLLESLPDDRAVLDRLFRCAHTLKGSSAMFGFERIATFTHQMENLLDVLRETSALAERRTIDCLLEAADVAKALVQEAAGEGAPDAAVHDEVLERLRTIAASLSRAGEPAQAHAAPAPASAEPVAAHAEPAHAPPEPFELAPDLAPEPTRELPRPGLASEPTRELPRLVASEPTRELVRPEGLSEPTRELARPEQGRAAADGGATIRVPIEKLDRLVNLVGEIVITQSMIAQLAGALPNDLAPTLADTVLAMERHCRELQERILAVRMVPVKTLVARFQRLVRDTAALLGKKVRLEVTGEETELDKTVIEKIGDPLTHIIRNAVDHGIEPPAKRLAAGKPEEGVVRLRAYQKSGSVYIEVTDDGKGLDRVRILAKAQERGLVPEGQTLTDAQTDELLFLPGFSTAERITEVSGRGVGMDVVRRNVEELKGSVTLTSRFGEGSTLQIKLPLTLAILEGLALGVGQHIYIAPLVSVVESVRPRREHVRAVVGVGEVVEVRGEQLPMVRLHDAFGVTPRETDPTRGLIVILDDGSTKMALFVDDLIGQYQVVIKSLETNYGRVQGVSGATILGDGRVALILDSPGLAALWHGRAARRSPAVTLAGAAA